MSTNSFYVEGTTYTEDSLIEAIESGDLSVSTNNPKTTMYVDNTSYNIQSHWIEIAQKYFSIDQSDTESINFLKAGFFGYFNEVAANEVKNATYHRNVLYDEHFLNTASFSKSILNFARIENISLLTSNPSHCLINFAIKKSDIINSGMKIKLTADEKIVSSVNNYKIDIDKDYVFSIDSYNFKIPYDMRILISENVSSKDYTITARYVTEDSEFPFSDLSSSYIDTWQDTVDGEYYIFFKLDLYQLSLSKTSYDVSNTNDISNNFYVVSFSDQLAYFEVYYTYGGVTTKLNTYFNNTYTPSNDQYFCYYTFIDDDKLQISFSNLTDSFTPQNNSILDINIYTTKGSSGNLNYLGEVTYSFSNNYDSSFNTFPVKVTTLTQPTGGKDQLTISEMKNKIIEKRMTRNNLVNDNDLELYFKNINSSININNSKIMFMKRRDDLLKRVYSAFLLLRDSSQKVLPTHTIPKLYVPDSFFEDQDSTERFIPEYTVIMYEPKINSYIPIKDFRASDYFVDEDGKILEYPVSTDSRTFFRLPYLLKLDTSPILKTNYFNLYIDDNFTLSYKYINNLVTTTFSITSIDIAKEIELEKDYYTDEGESGVEENLRDVYKISLKLNSSLNTDVELEKVLIRGIIYSKETDTKYGYFDFKKVEDTTSEYYYNITTNRKFYNDKIILYNSLYDDAGKLSGSDSSNAYSEVSIDEDTYIKIGILYKDEKTRNYVGATDSISTKEKQDFRATAPIITSTVDGETYESYNINEYTLADILVTNDTIHFYKNLGEYLNSYVTYESSIPSYDDFGNMLDIEGNITTNLLSQHAVSGYSIEMVPVIGFDYFQLKYDVVYNLINQYLEVFEGIMDKLENNTDIDIKFYNTFGPSKLFYLNKSLERNTDNEEVLEYEYISKLDILLDFNMCLYTTITSALDASIKQYISDFIESCNDGDIIPISNLLRLLESNFSFIKYIEYNGLSGDYSTDLVNKYQKIENKFTSFLDMTKDEIISYVPEYINIKKDASRNTTYVDGTEIELGISYDYIINITYTN